MITVAFVLNEHLMGLLGLLGSGFRVQGSGFRVYWVAGSAKEPYLEPNEPNEPNKPYKLKKPVSFEGQLFLQGQSQAVPLWKALVQGQDAAGMRCCRSGENHVFHLVHCNQL